MSGKKKRGASLTASSPRPNVLHDTQGAYINLLSLVVVYQEISTFESLMSQIGLSQNVLSLVGNGIHHLSLKL